jgi:hypothetical protein
MAERMNGRAKSDRLRTYLIPSLDNIMIDMRIEKYRMKPVQVPAGVRLTAKMKTRVKMIFTLA